MYLMDRVVSKFFDDGEQARVCYPDFQKALGFFSPRLERKVKAFGLVLRGIN